MAMTIIFIFGAIVGSFLNVCIYRLPDEQKSVIKPASYCPMCLKPIVWYDNIPLISYLILRGKCRQCSAPISIRYVLVELATAGMFVLTFSYFGLTARAVFLLYLFCSLVVASVIDLKFKIIPDEITFYGMLVGLLFSFCAPQVQFEVDQRLAIADSILGLLCGGAIIYVLAVVGSYIFKKEAMGGGDIKLLAMIGAFVGVKYTVIAFLLSPYFAIIFALYYKFVKKEATIPYGPFLSMGAVAAIFYGDQIVVSIFGL
ncbi:MAG: prepilin peptidase [Candidatus Omnitrophica bacterium]|nr:prepilin peptidase [Candidatus Omnitrophota bacterium]